MSTWRSARSTNPSLFEQAVESSMKRILGVNDGYGSPELRVAVLDGLNGLKASCSLNDVASVFGSLVELQNKRKNIVMYVSLRVEEMAIVTAMWKCNGSRL